MEGRGRQRWHARCGGEPSIPPTLPSTLRPPCPLLPLSPALSVPHTQIVQHGLTWTVLLSRGVRVVAAQLRHRVPCWGYVFQERMQRLGPAPPPDAGRGQQAADPAAAAAASASDSDGEGGSGAPPSGGGQLLVRPGRKLVILGDTCDSSAIAPLARNCDLLSHEATFCVGECRRGAPRVVAHTASAAPDGKRARAACRPLGAVCAPPQAWRTRRALLRTRPPPRRARLRAKSARARSCSRTLAPGVLVFGCGWFAARAAPTHAPVCAASHRRLLPPPPNTPLCPCRYDSPSASQWGQVQRSVSTEPASTDLDNEQLRRLVTEACDAFGRGARGVKGVGGAVAARPAPALTVGTLTRPSPPPPTPPRRRLGAAGQRPVHLHCQAA